MMHFQQLSNYGTSTPAVARGALQARDLLSVCNIKAEVQTELLQVVFDMERHLVRCVETRDFVQAEVDKGRAARARPRPTQQGGALEIPGVPDLQWKAESYLQAAKLGLAQAGTLLRPLYAKDREAKLPSGHKFADLHVWCVRELGAGNALTQMVGNAAPWVGRIVKMRNKVDHPGLGPGNSLIVNNFNIHQTDAGQALFPPSWHLLGEPPVDLAEAMSDIIDGMVSVQEDLVIGIFENFKAAPFLAVVEIPEAERDPACPKRFKVGMNESS